jgi:hypothetical protein
VIKASPSRIRHLDFYISHRGVKLGVYMNQYRTVVTDRTHTARATEVFADMLFTVMTVTRRSSACIRWARLCVTNRVVQKWPLKAAAARSF